MSNLLYHDIADAVLLTHENLIKSGSFLNLQTDLQDFVAVREMWKNRQYKFEGGDPWEFDIQTDQNHSAKFVGLYETDTNMFGDTMTKGSVHPCHMNAHYCYDLREKDFQRGAKGIVDLLKTKYSAMMMSWYELLESTLWSKPTDSTDTKTPFGVTYWIVKNSSTGFNGGEPSGFTAGRAGITTASQARWANYTAAYTAVSKEDLIRKMRTGARATNFRSPLSNAEPSVGSKKNGIYTNESVIGLMEEALEAQNMDLGNDLASKDGRTLFKGTPVTYVPKLDSDTSNPVYTIDWNWMAIGVLAGWENQLSQPYMVSNMSKVRRVDLDATLQMICTNLRRQAVYYVA